MEEQAEQAALITGGTGGLGKAVAVALARRGWSVFLQHAVAPSAAEDAAAEVAAAAQDAGLDVDVLTGRAELTVGAEREQLVEAVLESFGRIDMLVNAAPGARPVRQDLLEMTEDAYRDVIDRGVTSTVFLTQLVANEMVRQVEAGQIENPRIVTINSISAQAASVGYAPQCISRAALAMMSQLFADGLGVHGINVYEIRAGLITSGAGDPIHAHYDSRIEQGLTPLRRLGRPGDVARAVVAIADGLLSFSTGEVINVDGGFHVPRL